MRGWRGISGNEGKGGELERRKGRKGNTKKGKGLKIVA